jgi:hypothetical protein
VHNNYYLFRQLVPALEKEIKSARLGSCFSQNKDELILRFDRVADSFIIKAHLQSNFSCLSFPGRFDRARKNSADLFSALINLRVEGLHLFQYERSFALEFEGDWTLLFKMHGNRSNVLIFREGSFVDIFRKNLRQDSRISLLELDRNIDWTYDYFLRHQDQLSSAFFTLGKPVWMYLKARGFDSMSPEDQWRKLNEVQQHLLSPHYCAVTTDAAIEFTLLPVSGAAHRWDDPIRALSEFYSLRTRHRAYLNARTEIQGKLSTARRSRENALEKALLRLQTLQHEKNYREWADLLMANLQNIHKGKLSVSLPNYYDKNRPIEIKLKREWSAAQNAGYYYTKAKNQQKEIEQLLSTVERCKREISDLANQQQRLPEVKDITALKALVSSVSEDSTHKGREPESLFHRYEHMGFVILVGKNAKNNDLLITQHAYKEDLWFHVRDASGSHVLLKYQAGKQYPKSVITYAAQLAAYYSKRRSEHICPVVVTPRKYVRKRKGDPAGVVVLDREKTLMVTPGLVPAN